MWKQLASKSARHLPSAPGLWASPLSRTSVRPISATPSIFKDATERTKNNIQDRNSINPERSEGTMSGTDSEVTQHHSAFDPKTTKPESELEQTGRESEQEGKSGNPLKSSPANKDINAWKGTKESGKEH
ncbi:hypothetical protein N7495_004134 [Penicillium taxi]|uniref:uncharacterized protein n=1 Tax=Penicillium taxi TaxID=168475 RepID=UPI002544E347|nr:uncharacterized protein N7495_004134 [Penicillium taxi]KAJ5899390.1 hypothetical protein N7495_004134 [Penicillium taxi]